MGCRIGASLEDNLFISFCFADEGACGCLYNSRSRGDRQVVLEILGTDDVEHRWRIAYARFSVL